jgi:Uma2 family endonuclease
MQALVMNVTLIARDSASPGARAPIELNPPQGFCAERLETWPDMVGRLEFIEGKLIYMPPCAGDQAETVVDVVMVLAAWQRSHPEFVVRSNEAGMLLGGTVRAADVAVWRRAELATVGRGLPYVPPVLAVEVAGRVDTSEYLTTKVRWYLEMGVEVVWVVEPRERVLRVSTRQGETVARVGDPVPAHPALPGLAAEVRAFFVQLGA